MSNINSLARKSLCISTLLILQVLKLGSLPSSSSSCIFKMAAVMVDAMLVELAYRLPNYTATQTDMRSNMTVAILNIPIYTAAQLA